MDWDVLLCASDNADAATLAFVERAIERRDDFFEVVEEGARDWHGGFDARGRRSATVDSESFMRTLW